MTKQRIKGIPSVHLPAQDLKLALSMIPVHIPRIFDVQTIEEPQPEEPTLAITLMWQVPEVDTAADTSVWWSESPNIPLETLDDIVNFRAAGVHNTFIGTVEGATDCSLIEWTYEYVPAETPPYKDDDETVIDPNIFTFGAVVVIWLDGNQRYEPGVMTITASYQTAVSDPITFTLFEKFLS